MTEVKHTSHVVAVNEAEDHACAELLNLEGVFYLFKVDKHGAVVADWAKDEAVSTEFRESIGNVEMRVSILRTIFDTYRAPVGFFRSAVLDFDRAALLVLPNDDYTFGIALLKESATPTLIAKAQAILEHRLDRDTVQLSNQM